jgi:hypothetical protein
VTWAGGRRRLAVLFMACIQLLPAAAEAQQFATDDAGIADYRACQVEAWRGETASWLLPACHFIRNLEITAGMGFVQGMDVSWGGHTAAGGRGLGWVLGAAWTPPPFF